MMLMFIVLFAFTGLVGGLWLTLFQESKKYGGLDSADTFMLWVSGISFIFSLWGLSSLITRAFFSCTCGG